VNKFRLAEILKNRCNLAQAEAADIVNSFFSEMANTLAKDDRVEIRGLWSFHLKAYKSYTGRNPKTGEIVRVNAKKLPFFKCGKELKERADYPLN